MEAALSGLRVLWYTMAFMSPRWIHFKPQDYITHSLVHANRRHRRNSFTANRVSLQSNNHANVSFLCFRENHRQFGAKGSCSDCAFWQESLFFWTAVLWSGPIPDYPPQLHKLQNGFIISLVSLMSESMSVCLVLYKWLRESESQRVCSAAVKKRHTWQHFTY